MISEDRLAYIEALERDATAGPWFVTTDYGKNPDTLSESDLKTEAVWTVGPHADRQNWLHDAPVTGFGLPLPDAAFVVMARHAIPELVAEVRRLRGALEHGAQQLEALGEAWRCDWLDFDGRQLRDQLSQITRWMRQPEGPLTEGTEFYHSHVTIYHDFFPGCPKEFGCFRCERKRRKRARVKRPITKRPLPVHKEGQSRG